MNEKQLKVFLAVAATGSMNRAAAELSYAPQSVKEVVDGWSRNSAASSSTGRRRGRPSPAKARR